MADMTATLYPHGALRSDETPPPAPIFPGTRDPAHRLKHVCVACGGYDDHPKHAMFAPGHAATTLPPARLMELVRAIPQDDSPESAVALYELLSPAVANVHLDCCSANGLCCEPPGSPKFCDAVLARVRGRARGTGAPRGLELAAALAAVSPTVERAHRRWLADALTARAHAEHTAPPDHYRADPVLRAAWDAGLELKLAGAALLRSEADAIPGEE